MPEIECQIADKSPSQIVRERAARRRKATWKRKAAEKAMKPSRLQLTATVTQSTRDRLIADALHSPAFEGMEPAEVSAFVNGKLDGLLVNYPFWFGRLHSDAPRKPVSDAQRLACERMRQRKAEIQREADAPYIAEAAAV